MSKKLTYAQVRHNAAVKAWDTRKANLAAKVRHNAAKKAWVTRRASSKSEANGQPTGGKIVDALLNANTPGKKAAATRWLNEYVLQREGEGKDPKMVRAGIMARVARITNGNA